MTTESNNNGLKYIQASLNSNKSIILNLERAEKVFKDQEEIIKALRAKLTTNNNKDINPKKNLVIKNEPDTALSNHGNKKKITTTAAETNAADTVKLIHMLQQESKMQRLKVHELLKENEELKNENRKLKAKMDDKQKTWPIKPALNDGKNQTKSKKRKNSPFDEVQRRFSPTGTSNKRRKPSQL